MNLTVLVAASNADRWRAQIEVPVTGHRYRRAVRLTGWFENAGKGQTYRAVEVDYGDIPELVALLVKALADRGKEEREEQ